MAPLRATAYELLHFYTGIAKKDIRTRLTDPPDDVVVEGRSQWPSTAQRRSRAVRHRWNTGAHGVPHRFSDRAAMRCGDLTNRRSTALPSAPYDRTLAISGSRPYADHTAGFHRESAALHCSACGHRALAKPLDDPAVCDGLHSNLLIERHRLWCRKQQQH